MNIKLVAVGKLKEKYFIDACAEYEKRLSRYCALSVQEVADERIPESFSASEARIAIEREGARILSQIKDNEHVIALCVGGKRMDSEAFSQRISSLAFSGAPVAFVIGGSDGLSDAALSRANERLSLSDMTLPHRIARLVLLEQIYRAFKIARGETYHK